MFEFLGKRRIIYIAGLALFIISLVIIYVIMNRPAAEAEQNTGRQDNRDGNVAHLAYRTEPQSKLYFERFYTKCGDLLTEETHMAYTHAGKTREDMLLAYPTWKLTEFAKDKVVFRKDIDGYCPMHYIIKNNNGYLAVYRSLKETGELYIENELDIRFDWLDSRTQQEIRKGLVVDTAEEVEKLVENWFS